MQNPDNCREVVRQLWPYLDGALPDEWQERVAAHLAACDNCTSHFDFAAAFLDAVRMSAAAVGGLERLHTRILSALQAEGMPAL